MKTKLLLPFIFICNICLAQSFDQLNINNVISGVNSSGELFSDIPNFTQPIQFPANSSSITFGTGSLWIASIDSLGQLHTACQTYRQTGVDFFQGPMMNSNSYSPAQDALWDKVWKINKTTIDSFIQGLFGTNIPASISNWPGNGNTILGQAPKLAPYADINFDGQYNPINGDYPVIKGDQAIFFIFNDDRNIHGETGGQKLELEIQGMAYAFNCPNDSALNNTIFVHYRIINYSQYSYDPLNLGFWYDLDMGVFTDDVIGTDSTRNVCYFLDSLDVMSTVFLNQNISNSMVYNNDFSVRGNPQQTSDYYGYLIGEWKDSTQLTYGGNGYGGISVVDYAYTGDPFNGTGWYMLTGFPADYRNVLSTDYYYLQPSDTLAFDLAFVFARNYGGQPYNQLNIVKTRIDSIQSYYNNDLTPCGSIFSTSVSETPKPNNNISVYPNPANENLFVNFEMQSKNVTVRIYDVTGNLVKQVEITNGNSQINISQLAQGLYLIKITDGENIYTKKFLKQ